MQQFGRQQARRRTSARGQNADEATDLQAAYAACRQPACTAGLVRFSCSPRATIPLIGASQGVGAHRLIDLARAVPGVLQWHLHMSDGGRRAIVGDKREPAAAQPTPPAQLLQGICALGGVVTVETDTAVSGRLWILRLHAAVGEQHERQSAAAVALERARNAFIGQQPLHELKVRLPILDAAVAHGCRGQSGQGIVAPAPAGQSAVRAEHVLDDVPHGPLLMDTAAPRMPQEPRPWHEMQPIARQTAVCAKEVSGGDVAAAMVVLAIIEAGDQRGAQSRPVSACQARIRMHGIYPVIETVDQAFVAPPLFDEQGRQALSLQPMQLPVRPEPRQRRVRSCRM